MFMVNCFIIFFLIFSSIVHDMPQVFILNLKVINVNKKKWLFYVLCDSNTFVIKYKLLQYKLLKLLYIVSLQPSYDVHHSKNCRMQYFSVHVLMADAHKPKYFFIKYKALYTCRFNIQGAGIFYRHCTSLFFDSYCVLCYYFCRLIGINTQFYKLT